MFHLGGGGGWNLPHFARVTDYVVHGHICSNGTKQTWGQLQCNIHVLLLLLP